MAAATQLEKTPPATPGQPQLTDRLAGIWSRGRVRWMAMKPAQRFWGITAVVLLVGLIAALAWFALRTDWRTLYLLLYENETQDCSNFGQ